MMRVIIFAAAFKFPYLCNAHFYNEVLLCMLSAFFPRKAFQDGSYMAEAYLQAVFIIFCLFYNSFWRSLICCTFVQIAVFVAQKNVHKSSSSINIAIFVSLLVFQCLTLSLCHIFITKISFMYVNSEVSQLNDQALFNVLE